MSWRSKDLYWARAGTAELAAGRGCGSAPCLYGQRKLQSQDTRGCCEIWRCDIVCNVLPCERHRAGWEREVEIGAAWILRPTFGSVRPHGRCVCLAWWCCCCKQDSRLCQGCVYKIYKDTTRRRGSAERDSIFVDIVVFVSVTGIRIGLSRNPLDLTTAPSDLRLVGGLLEWSFLAI